MPADVHDLDETAVLLRVCGLGAALSALPSEVRMLVSGSMWESARLALTRAERAEELAKHIPAEDFRDGWLEQAETYARLWRECTHA